MTPRSWKLVCLDCAREHAGLEVRYRCDCGGTLDVVHDLEALRGGIDFATFDRRLVSKEPANRSGVWRFRELILPVDAEAIATRGEGNTGLYESKAVASYVGLSRVQLKHEGENPTGSFKDRGMCVGITVAGLLGKRRVACASTGNTSASMASYAAGRGLEAIVFIPEGKIAFGKLSQALAYGAKTIQIEGDFDDAMRLVQQVCDHADIYLLNSINPFRIEGQKAIGFELLQDRDWQVPDWIVLPGGNLGNNSALSKGLMELKALGLIEKLPRIAVIQAHGANPLYRAFSSGEPLQPLEGVETIATAIRIGNPVSGKKSLRGLAACHGVVEEVTDDEILEAKAVVDAAGIGAEPASCATVAGMRKLAASGVIDRGADVCGILTGHLLKDPDTVVRYHRGELGEPSSKRRNTLIQVEPSLEAILAALD